MKVWVGTLKILKMFHNPGGDSLTGFGWGGEDPIKYGGSKTNLGNQLESNGFRNIVI